MYEIKVAAENAVIIYFGNEIKPDLIHKIAFYRDAIRQSLADVIIDIVPSYTTLMISYRIEHISYVEFCQQLSQLLAIEFQAGNTTTSRVDIPVYYDVEVGLDLADVLLKTQLSLDEFIACHSTPAYLTYAIGFSPAFAFLGTVDQQIQLPRLTTPRISIPAGSVGIAHNQTAVYPVNSAGGWNIIGRTPLNLSLHDEANLHRFELGCRVKFTPITRQQFIELGGVL